MDPQQARPGSWVSGPAADDHPALPRGAAGQPGGLPRPERRPSHWHRDARRRAAGRLHLSGDAATDRSLVAPGGDGPPYLLLERDARHLADHRRRLSLLAAAHWVAAVGADGALNWLSRGFEPDQAAAWVNEGVERPEGVAGWHDLGGEEPTATGAWKDAGVAIARRPPPG